MKSATRVTVSAFGALVGVAGIEHGIGETLQGNSAPTALMFLSWPGSGPFSMLGGEPAMTIIPNLLVTGILAVLVSLSLLIWATLFIQREHGGPVLILLSIVMLLVGGGLVPPVLGIILGAAATRINAPFAWWRSHLPMGVRLFLAACWPWSLGAGLGAWLLMFPGLVLLAYFFGLSHNPGLVSTLALCMLGFLFSTLIAGFACDLQKQTDAATTHGVQKKPGSSAAFEWKR